MHIGSIFLFFYMPQNTIRRLPKTSIEPQRHINRPHFIFYMHPRRTNKLIKMIFLQKRHIDQIIFDFYMSNPKKNGFRRTKKKKPHGYPRDSFKLVKMLVSNS